MASHVDFHQQDPATDTLIAAHVSFTQLLAATKIALCLLIARRVLRRGRDEH